MTNGLPQAVEAEIITLGSILADQRLYLDAASVLEVADFSLDKHQRIFRRMGDLAKRSEAINYTTVYYELGRYNEAESVGGLSYLVSLTNGIPEQARIDSYLRLVKEKAQLRKVVYTCESIRNRVMSGAESYEEIIGETTKALFGLTDQKNGSGAEDIEGIIQEEGGISKFLEEKRGISTPWPSLDRDTGGWQDGELVLLAGRPGMGKTALALNAVWHAAVRGTPSVFYSYEMSKGSVLRRLVSLLARMPYKDLAGNKYKNDPEKRKIVADTVAEIGNLPILIVNASGKTAFDIRLHMEKLKRRSKLGLAAVDYIGLMKPMPRASQNRTQELGETCRLLKEAAGELQVPLLVLSQLNRAVEMRQDRIPTMADLRDSGELENHADLIAFIHRPGYYNREQASLKFETNLIIAKHRNGATGTIKLNFREEWGKFFEVDEGLEDR